MRNANGNLVDTTDAIRLAAWDPSGVGSRRNYWAKIVTSRIRYFWRIREPLPEASVNVIDKTIKSR